MNFILDRAKAVSLRVAIAAVMVIALVIAVLVAQSRYLSNFFSGPTPMSREALATVKSADSVPQYWVNLSADQVHATGYEEITIRKKRGVERSRKVTSRYFIAEVGDRLLLVKAHDDTPTTKLTGELKPTHLKTEREILASDELKSVRDRFYPVMLDTADFRKEGYFGLAAAAIVLLFAAYFGITRLQRYLKPETHPVVIRAKKWGPLSIISSIIESDLKEGNVLKVGGYSLTPHHLYKNGLFKLTLEHLDELVWAYEQVTQNKMMYFIPTGKSYALKLHWDKRELTINGKEDVVIEALERIETNRPWLPIGHSEEVAQFFKKQKERFVAQVKKARADAKRETQFGSGFGQ